MKKAKQNRRAAIDFEKVMLPYKNSFRDWAYAGEEKTIRKLFREEIASCSSWAKEINEGYFDIIPKSTFKDKTVVKTYGMNLGKQREEKGWTLYDVANMAGISPQLLQQIETGNRQKIHKNLLLIFCAIYHKSPETLMGSEKKLPAQAMIFEKEASVKKARYIVSRLVEQDPELLNVFVCLVDKPVAIRRKLAVFLQNALVVKVLKSNQFSEILESDYECPLSTERDGMQCFDPITCCCKLTDADLDTPELIDVFVSIAAGNEEVWKAVIQLISNGGFLR